MARRVELPQGVPAWHAGLRPIPSGAPEAAPSAIDAGGAQAGAIAWCAFAKVGFEPLAACAQGTTAFDAVGKLAERLGLTEATSCSWGFALDCNCCCIC